MWPAAFIGILALALNTPAGDPERGDDYNEGYRRGFQEGFAAGYRQAAAESEQRAAAAAAAAASAAAAAASRPTGPITVSSAAYGTSSKACNATHWVARRVNGRRSASVDVSNSICGDPSPGERKSLEITYLCGSVVRNASAYEHRTAYLDCNG